MAYIKGDERHDTCFLCDAAEAAAERDEENLVVARGPAAFVILNKFPYNSGHLMVAPYRHVGELDDLNHDETDDVWDLTRRSVRAHREASQPQGFNIGINLGEVAGAGVPGHFHLHVVPRWGGDTNFMSVTAQTRLVPEELDVTFDKLQPHFEKIRKDLFA